MRLINLLGRRFERLVVESRAENTPLGQARWRCRCDCGNMTEAVGSKLTTGKTKSCGCYLRDLARNRRGIAHHLHKHGEAAELTPEYRSWQGMIYRCENPNGDNWENYGGRGITVCERWRTSFENFLADVGRRPTLSHSIDRKDPDGHYNPENCRWATKQEQRVNQRPHKRSVRT